MMANRVPCRGLDRHRNQSRRHHVSFDLTWVGDVGANLRDSPHVIRIHRKGKVQL
jgi:hypothetical protein